MKERTLKAWTDLLFGVGFGLLLAAAIAVLFEQRCSVIRGIVPLMAIVFFIIGAMLRTAIPSQGR